MSMARAIADHAAPILGWRRRIAGKPPKEEWYAMSALTSDADGTSYVEWVVHRARSGHSISRSAGELIRHLEKPELLFENKADAVAFCEKQEYEMTRDCAE